MLPNALLLQLPENKNKQKYRHRSRNHRSMCSGFPWGELIMKKKNVGSILGTELFCFPFNQEECYAISA